MHVNLEMAQYVQNHVVFLGYDLRPENIGLESYIEQLRKRIPLINSKGEVRKMLEVLNLFRTVCPQLGTWIQLLQDILVYDVLPSVEKLRKLVGEVWKYVLHHNISIPLMKDVTEFP